jgi:acyl-coenzyme A synthetase/AMP-(fatty) acid ligase
MLYRRWLETSRRFAEHPALSDDGGTMSFAELAAAAESAPRATSPVIARTGASSFFIDVLRAWRDGQAVIPVERDAPEPVLKSTPPPGTRLVKHTPGASGIPRGIFFNAEQLTADCDRIVAAMGLSHATTNLAVISLSHSYGFGNVVLPLLLCGVPAHLLPLPYPRVVEEALRMHASPVLPAVPAMWRAWQRAGILKKMPCLAISAGAPLSLELERDVFDACGLKIHNFYGASECGAITWDDSAEPRASADILGKPFPGVNVSPDADGRLRVASDAVAIGYDEPRPGDVIGDGVHLTRDTGYFDANALLHLTTTLGGAINVAGRKVSPAKVEAAIMATGLAAGASVWGIPSADPERHREIAASVELVPSVTAAALKAALTGRLQAWELPRHWKFTTRSSARG